MAVASDVNATMNSTSRGGTGDDCDRWRTKSTMMTSMTLAAVSARNSTMMRRRKRTRIDNSRVAFRLKCLRKRS